jgi:protein-S-isoprenylcysteine O-methyltransferase Ste14
VDQSFIKYLLASNLFFWSKEAQMKRYLFHFIALLITGCSWLFAVDFFQTPTVRFWVSIGGILIIIPIVLAGRLLLDREPTLEKAQSVTTWIHYLISIFMGSAVLEAIQFGRDVDTWSLRLSPWFGLAIMLISSLAILLVVLNLALKGLGFPIAMALTREIVTEWFYAWTRNPIALSGLVLLIGFGLWIQSGLFLAWVLAIVTPAIFIFLKVFEERELEIRFGQTYLDYKSRTPWMLPRKPSKP